MSNYCKNICTNIMYNPKKLVRNVSQTLYKRCSKCCMFLKDVGIFCPCCGNRMKVSPSNNKSRKLYREEKNGV